MRLLYVVPPLESPGGVTRSARRMIDAMQQRHEVSVVSPDPDLFVGDVRLEGNVHRFGIVEPWIVKDWIPFVRDAVHDTKAEVVFGYYGTTAGHAAVAGAHLGVVPSVLCLRGNDVDRDADLPDRGALLRAAIEGATEIATVSTQMAARVKERFAREATFVQSSVDRERFYFDPMGRAAFRARWNLTRPVLGIFGELKEKRGLDRLANADLDRWQVMLVGRIRPEVRRHVRETWIQVPYLDDGELRAAYSSCDVVLQPSHHDGMPNVVLEAMACERTVVASRAGGLPDLIEHGVNGLLFDHAELGHLLRDPPDLGAAARARVPSIERERSAMEALALSAFGRAPPAE